MKRDTNGNPSTCKDVSKCESTECASFQLGNHGSTCGCK